MHGFLAVAGGSSDRVSNSNSIYEVPALKTGVPDPRTSGIFHTHYTDSPRWPRPRHGPRIFPRQHSVPQSDELVFVRRLIAIILIYPRVICLAVIFHSTLHAYASCNMASHGAIGVYNKEKQVLADAFCNLCSTGCINPVPGQLV